MKARILVIEDEMSINDLLSEIDCSSKNREK